jgi:hypothetical protein
MNVAMQAGLIVVGLNVPDPPLAIITRDLFPFYVADHLGKIPATMIFVRPGFVAVFEAFRNNHIQLIGYRGPGAAVETEGYELVSVKSADAVITVGKRLI